jgi:hypothetical protein
LNDTKVEKVFFHYRQENENSSFAYHHDSQNVYESTMSNFDTKDECTQHFDARMQKANENEAFAYEKKTSENSILPCILKKLIVIDIYK